MTNANGVKSPLSPNVLLLNQGNYLLSCMTILRDSETATPAFSNAFEKVATQLIVAALDLVPTEAALVKSPTGVNYDGQRQSRAICGVSILRAGASFESALRNAATGPLSFGKILIQRNEETSLPTHIYSKLPGSIASNTVLILEPMLATGGSAAKAISILEEAGVPEEEIIFVNVVASQYGIRKVLEQFPRLRIVTAAVDDDLTASK
ncbi:uracil phosphoribosyltransferase [Grosmannia clavigera kw1407]|uniref:uracil phosphoribosyltransferase n=1 Tax=Grosmannia clavigera (strain kw1407 / UAMH 11150) TaxID=655863 RepID=F0XC29_GROCL|nr:uracil phosphoribosyltransferase [Grosmannia clavigera kw1407]EFX04170.1 uracil phosphoribosyltransferase [Grosmannia clavigera kw1407]